MWVVLSQRGDRVSCLKTLCNRVHWYSSPSDYRLPAEDARVARDESVTVFCIRLCFGNHLANRFGHPDHDHIAQVQRLLTLLCKRPLLGTPLTHEMLHLYREVDLRMPEHHHHSEPVLADNSLVALPPLRHNPLLDSLIKHLQRASSELCNLAATERKR